MTEHLPDPHSNPELFDGVLTRRVFAYLVDFLLMSLLTGLLFVITLVLGIVTFGLAWLTLPIIFPLAVVIYYVVTLGGNNRATPGMRMFDLVLTPTSGPPLNGAKSLLHPFVFWITIWIFWPLLAIGLFTQRRQLLHDMITGTLMLRRSPMERHWSGNSWSAA